MDKKFRVRGRRTEEKLRVVEEALKKVRGAGEKVLEEPMDIPGIGLYAGFLDTEGNRVSLLQPSAQMSPIKT